MFEATFAKALLFKHVIEATRELVADINIKFTRSDINFTSMDSLHITLISVYLNKERFKRHL
ncbi:9880_t:CDS:2 [Cetraspora pellucida]|uniref:9880_t:CDS:1 n=1 Tax=Cetraspora pellucida TaxID=1433469 RepID=A0A9N8VJ33_9GLOM|nr:9880_t:CDS:2 [Cetraspora pellucida]